MALKIDEYTRQTYRKWVIKDINYMDRKLGTLIKTEDITLEEKI